MTNINVIAQTDVNTVVSEYTPVDRGARTYQSEDALEKEFIALLGQQGYEYVSIKNEQDLIDNLRVQLEKLNDYTFSDSEWKQFFKTKLANPGESIVDKTRKIQEDYVQVLIKDDGSSKNIKLMDKTVVFNNSTQVINQYEEEGGTFASRYDVTILINGFPMVHVELKRRGVHIKEAFNQINRYQRTSFWANTGLYEYIQIFVISNGTQTKYYSNTTRDQHIKQANSNSRSKSSHSFEFTSYWADAKNKVIYDLVDFTKTFFVKMPLLKILTKYCVFTSENMLLVMRPYQIVATEQIMNRIEIAKNYKLNGSIDGGGYIWHTTGSGKTLTSFKTAQLAKDLPYVDKVLFVVDRKDLDYQTMQEYERFEKGCASSNTSTNVLQKQLSNNESKIIITTIQKLDRFIAKNKTHDVYKKHVVFIFDECHRSQFGSMHTNITKNFKHYNLFGFTGTPIFANNANKANSSYLTTTEQAFGRKLHTYTIVDAISDGNVLPFRIDYVNTLKMDQGLIDSQVSRIDTEKAMADPKRISEVTKYILEHFDQKTKRNHSYSLKGQRMHGFNSIFAVSSIPVSKLYYNEFKRQMGEGGKKLNVATIFSFNPNEEDPTEESLDLSGLDQSSREFLEEAIQDYNTMFQTNFDSSADKFENYYKDLSLRVKNREVDLLIVVNMFLTGFDATTLNTLWVDKNLKYHGLIQAYSRTNRILNSVKTFGNIVCFRNLQKETDEAISLFGNKEACGIVILKTFEEYYNGFEDNNKQVAGYEELITTLTTKFPLGEEIIGLESAKEFIKLYGAILRLRNILQSFDAFEDKEILEPRDFQDYSSIYLDLRDRLPMVTPGEKTVINEDIVFELELIKQVEVNIDYILQLVQEHLKDNQKDDTLKVTVRKAVNSSIELRSKKELIEKFLERVNVGEDVQKDWHDFVLAEKEEEITALIEKERLKKEETVTYLNNALRDGNLKTSGTDIDKLLPPVSMFGKKNNRSELKIKIIDLMQSFYDKYQGVV